MNSDLTPVPLEAARARSALTLMGFITPNSRAELATGQANENSIRHAGGVLGGNGACVEHSRSV
ncbi:MAG: hypothetical protein UY64_C0044G0003 [Parcubacteria group bacterium GW2011_GWA1_51_12]|nr:MAG: hypothetical protein UY64_C0044G0003 [Parcubacteria group bacterium GW2011_GWA1_51_12]